MFQMGYIMLLLLIIIIVLGRKIGCIEEAAYKMGFIDDNQLRQLAQPLLKSGYGNYLLSLLK